MAKRILIADDAAFMTDDVVGEALKEKGYVGIEEYDKYLLDFYNEKYGKKGGKKCQKEDQAL